MLFRRPSSLPISANVVALKPLREKHLAAAVKMAATRGFSQSTARGAVVVLLESVDSMEAWGALSAVFMVLFWTGQPENSVDLICAGVAVKASRRPSVW